MRSTFAEVSCDTCQDYIVTERTMRDAVRVARKDGWILAPQEKGGDLCPDCQRQFQKTIDAITAEPGLRAL